MHLGVAFSFATLATLNAQVSWDGGGVNDEWSTTANWSPDGSPAGQNVTFTDVDETTSTTVNSVVNNPTGNPTYTWTVESLTFNNTGTTANDWQNLSISEGVTLRVDAAGTPPPIIFTVGGLTADATKTQVKISGSGSLVVDESASDFLVANRNTATSANQAVLDMSGLSSFSATVNNFIVGGPSATYAVGSLSGYLALAESNTITATKFLVGSGTGQGNTSTLLLGKTNTLNSDSYFIGAHGGNFASSSSNQLSANVSFNSTLSSATDNTLVIRASDGISRADLKIGDHGTVITNRSVTANVNLAGGTVDALIGNLNIGISRGNQASLNGRMTASLSMDEGIIDATNTVLGRTASGGGGTTAPNTSTLTVFGGTFTSDSFTMGWNSGGSQDLTANLNIGGDARFSVDNGIVVGDRDSSTANVQPTITMGGGSLTVGGNIAEASGGGSITSVFNLNGGVVDLTNHAIGVDVFNATAGTLKNVSQINDGAASPAATALIKSGNGSALTLGGVNAFTGGMTINGGALLIDAGALTSSGTITINAGGALGLNYAGVQSLLNSGRVATGSAGSIALTTANATENIDLSASGANMSAAYLGAFGDVTYSGTYTPYSAGIYRLGGGLGTLTYGGNITGTNSVILGGGVGTVVLSGTNDFTGGIALNTGRLRVTALDDLGDAANTLTFDGGALQWASGFTGDVSTGRTITVNAGGATLDTNGNAVTLASSIGNSGTGGLTKTGAGVLSLSGLSTYTGATSVNTGTLALNLGSNPSGAINAASGLVLNGGTLSITGAGSGASGQSFSAMTLGASSGSSIAINPSTGAGTTLTPGSWSRGVGGTLNIDLSLGGTVASSPTLDDGILAYTTVTSGGATGFATVTSGALARYAAASTLGAGSSGATTNFIITGSVSRSATSSINSLQINNTAVNQIDLNGRSLTINSGGLLMTGTADYSILNTSATVASVSTGSSEFIIHHYGTGTLTIESPVATTGGLTKTGTGVLNLTGTTSTYTGVTSITGGVLGVASLANGGTASSLGSATSAASNLVLNGGTLRYIGSTTSTTDKNFTVGSNGGTIESSGTGRLTIWGSMTASATSGSQTFTLGGTSTLNNRMAGNISDGAGSVTSFVKSGAGTWTVSGYNDYSGSTTVSVGTLIVDGTLARTSGVEVAESGALGGKGTINSNLTLMSGSELTMELNGATAVAGYDQLAINGSIDLAGANLVLALNYAPVDNQIFTLLLNDGSNAIGGAFATINGGAFGVGNTFTLTYDSVSYDAQLFYTGNGVSTTGGNDLAVQVVQAVPEPSTVGLIAFTVLGAFYMVRRRRAAV